MASVTIYGSSLASDTPQKYIAVASGGYSVDSIRWYRNGFFEAEGREVMITPKYNQVITAEFWPNGDPNNDYEKVGSNRIRIGKVETILGIIDPPIPTPPLVRPPPPPPPPPYEPPPPVPLYLCPDGWDTIRQDSQNGYCKAPTAIPSGAPRVFYFGPQSEGYPLNRRPLADYMRDSYEQQIIAYSERSPTWPPVPHPAVVAPPPPPPIPPPPPPPPTPPPIPEPLPPSILLPPRIDTTVNEVKPDNLNVYLPYIIGGVLIYFLLF